MQTLDKEDAEALAFAIEYGLTEASEAIESACTLVVQLERPSEHLLELSGIIRPHPLDVVNLLRRWPGPSDPVIVFRKVLRRALVWVRKHPEDLSRVTYALESMAIADQVPEEFAQDCYGLDDMRWLAEQGTYGTIEQVRVQVLAFLEEEAEG
jgi:hypothetical protein